MAMRIDILCVGRLKEAYWRDAAQEYLKRLSRYARVEIVHIQHVLDQSLLELTK